MLTLRLQRIGKKKSPSYRLIVSEKARDTQGKSLEILGTYNPLPRAKAIAFKSDRVKHWLSLGAQASNTVHNLLVSQGIIAETGKRKSVAISKTRTAKMNKEKEALIAEETKKKAAEEAARVAAEEAKKAAEEAAAIAASAPAVVEAESLSVASEASTNETVEAPAQEPPTEEPKTEEAVA